MGKWDDLKISKKLVIGFAALIILSAAVGYVGFNGLSEYATRVENANLANEIELLGTELRGEMKNFQIVGFDDYGGRGKTTLDGRGDEGPEGASQKDPVLSPLRPEDEEVDHSGFSVQYLAERIHVHLLQ